METGSQSANKILNRSHTKVCMKNTNIEKILQCLFSANKIIKKTSISLSVENTAPKIKLVDI